MRKPYHAATVVLGLFAVLAVFGTAGCGDKTPDTPPGAAATDATKHMGGPPPANRSGGGGNMPPQGYMAPPGARPGGPPR
jgi:predicted small lipoprotein YifL